MSDNQVELLSFSLKNLDTITEEEQKVVQSLFDQRNDVYLYGDITITKNLKSGSIYLTDEDFSCYVLDNESGDITEWLYCPVCGKEGILSDMEKEGDDCCMEYLFEKGDIPSYLTLELAKEVFETDYLPILFQTYDLNDVGAINYEFGVYVDNLHKEGTINNFQYNNWVLKSVTYKGLVIDL